MNFLKTLLIVTAFALVAGCTPTGSLKVEDTTSPEAIALGVTTSANPHKGVKEFFTKPVFQKNSMFNAHYSLRAWRKSVTNTFVGAQIYISIPTYVEYSLFNAAFSKGEQLDFTLISREIRTCSPGACGGTETVGINLTEAQLKRYAQTGFVGEISGKRDNLEIEIPATYFQGFLIKFNA